MTRPPFHLAFPVHDLEEARRFYVGVLDCGVGRSSDQWLDLDLRGHQLTAHLSPPQGAPPTNPVEGHDVPTRHFGLVLPWDEWEELVERLQGAGVEFIIGPDVRFRGRRGEQATAFIRDPSGNALEFKAFRDLGEMFASDP